MDITALGELLVDFTEHGTGESGMRLFEQNPGGAVANVLAAAAKFGHSTAFLGKVGKDMHGLFLKETLEGCGINTDGLVMDEGVFTTLAFVALSPQGERTFSFARKPGADTMLRPEEVRTDILGSSRILHIGSLSLTHEPARSATRRAIQAAKAADCVLTYDPNYRASLWPDRETAQVQMRSVLPDVDLIKLSDQETDLLAGCSDPAGATKALTAGGIACAAVTLGERGALVCVGGETAWIPPCPGVPVVDTTGAGDAFWGGFLHGFLEGGKAPEELTLSDAVSYACWGSAAAALCIQKRGAIPAMPGKAETARLAEELARRV